MLKYFLSIALICLAVPCLAHGFGGSGFLHPLTGLDHMVAMIAVGSWSAQLGGKAIYRVPFAFLLMMSFGGLLGMRNVPINYTEYGISISVIMLGISIAIDKKMALFLAASAVGLFGFCHGYSHGSEMPLIHNPGEYIAGFLITTATLHILGAAGGLLLLEDKSGRLTLRCLGILATALGIYFFIKLIAS